MYEQDLAFNNLQWLICHRCKVNLLDNSFFFINKAHSTLIRF